MKLKEITQKILKGDFSSLFKRTGDHQLHPVEVAHVISRLPADSAHNVFISFSEQNQIDIFSYLEPVMQKKLIQTLPAENAAHILNSLNSDDRVAFFASIRDVEIGRAS